MNLISLSHFNLMACPFSLKLCSLFDSYLQRELDHGLMHRSNSVPDIREDGSVSLRRNTVRLTLTSPQIGKKFVMTPYKSPTYGKSLISFRVRFVYINKICSPFFKCHGCSVLPEL